MDEMSVATQQYITIVPGQNTSKLVSTNLVIGKIKLPIFHLN